MNKAEKLDKIRELAKSLGICKNCFIREARDGSVVCLNCKIVRNKMVMNRRRREGRCNQCGTKYTPEKKTLRSGKIKYLQTCKKCRIKGSKRYNKLK